LLLKWDTDRDTFEDGQWLKGRIYERRCDLSPSGDKLIYFAANYKKPYYSWIAISRPPFLTALALWPVGDTWTGGGRFNEENEINFSEERARSGLVDGYKLPPWLKFRPPTQSQLADFGMGADRLQRDGWELTQKGDNWWWRPGAKLMITSDPPTIWSHQHPDQPYLLRMIIRGYNEKNGPREIVEYEILDQRSGTTHAVGRSDWVDWDPHSGDLLYAQNGCLYRQPWGKSGPASPQELIDLRDRRFEQRKAPAWATKWSP
jgi:hypothetical protein